MLVLYNGMREKKLSNKNHNGFLRAYFVHSYLFMCKEKIQTDDLRDYKRTHQTGEQQPKRTQGKEV